MAKAGAARRAGGASGGKSRGAGVSAAGGGVNDATMDGVERPDLHPVEGMAAEEGALALDRLIHERMRLGIVSALAVNATLTFGDLKTLLRTTDGNLSVHARKLEEAEYIACTKTFEGRVPRTEYHITPRGRRALERYLDHMEALIRATRDR